MSKRDTQIEKKPSPDVRVEEIPFEAETRSSLMTDRKEHIAKLLRRYRPSNMLLFGYVFLIFGCLIIMVSVLTYLASLMTVTTYNSTQLVATTEVPHEVLSFTDLPAVPAKVELHGFIERRIEYEHDLGIHRFYLIDDDNEQIVLRGSLGKLDELMPTPGTSDTAYTVSGKLSEGYKTLELAVDAIDPYHQAQTIPDDTVAAYTVEYANITQPKYPLLRTYLYRSPGVTGMATDGETSGIWSIAKWLVIVATVIAFVVSIYLLLRPKKQ